MRRPLVLLVGVALFATWWVGLFGRGYWTPDEPREADISWRMSWQDRPAVPLLAGEAFCEKPPLNYWLAGGSIRLFGPAGWAARLPNLLYAVITTLAVWWLGRRSLGVDAEAATAAVAGAAAGGSLLLSYQVAIWLATDAPLLAASAVALAGAYAGFYAVSRRARLLGYLAMHAALCAGFLAKSAAAWMVPVLVLSTLIVWERRWRELLRFELWIGVVLQALVIGLWVWFVYRGPDGIDHLRVFFWNNLVGRFTNVAAPAELQYAAAHQNSPGKYLLEMPVTLWPWTLLVAAAIRRAWLARKAGTESNRALRFALAATIPMLLVLSVAATARNIYFAPALPGVALLLGWWVREILVAPQVWDVLALRATAVMLLVATLVFGLAVGVLGVDGGGGAEAADLVISALGLSAAAWLAVRAWACSGRREIAAALLTLFLACSALLAGPAVQVYHQVDRWQDLGALGRAVRADVGAAPLVLMAPDETTRAWVDMYVNSAAARVAGPADAVAIAKLDAALRADPRARVLTQLQGREFSPQLRALVHRLGFQTMDAPLLPPPAWIAAAGLRIEKSYGLPNGRRYAVLARGE